VIPFCNRGGKFYKGITRHRWVTGFEEKMIQDFSRTLVLNNGGNLKHPYATWGKIRRFKVILDSGRAYGHPWNCLEISPCNPSTSTARFSRIGTFAVEEDSYRIV
jgi:hypothetical protein